MNKKFMAIIIFITLTALYVNVNGNNGNNVNVNGNDDLKIEITPGRYPPYIGGDTIIIGVKATIPQGYHLYSNPLGPGIGKPLNLFINRRKPGSGQRGTPWGVAWGEARKSIPKRYNPPIGSWVWAYESEAYFFVKGVLERDTAFVDTVVNTINIGADVKVKNINTDVKAKQGDVKAKPTAAAKGKEADKGKIFGGEKGKASDAKKGGGKKGEDKNDVKAAAGPPVQRAVVYDVIIEALMCKAACVPILKSVSFEVPVPSDTAQKAVGSNVNTSDINTSSAVNTNDTNVDAEAANASVNTGISAANTNPGIVFPSAPALQSQYAKSESMNFTVGAPASGGGAPEIAALPGISGAPIPGGINASLSGLSSPYGDAAGSPDYQNEDSASGAVSLTGGGAYDYSPLEDRREYSLLSAVLFALLAGLALNLTPCIFPMLSVRVLSFAESALESRRSAVVRSAVFSLGIVAVFLLLAGLAAFAGFSWGQQFQNPGMMVGIIAIVFLFALGMFNFYTLSVPAIGGGGAVGGDKGPSFAGDFLKGAAATVMATPCGGPFLGALLAWALLQKPLTIFVLFATMGVGMALPYVMLASSKRLMSLLPKPGRWIEDLKYFMGFLLLAFAVNMMRSLDPRLVATAVGICLSILIAVSVNKRFAQFGAPAGRRVGVAFISLILLTAGIIISVTYLKIDVQIFNDDHQGIDGIEGIGGPYWSSFSARALAEAHEEKRNVIVNFTASWCTNCKLNKAAALNTAAARQLYAEKNVLLLTADITNDNPEAQELMRHLGSRSVPFLAIFPGDEPKRPVIMRDILSREKFLGELRNLP
jgi:thiol:disulfide interchange protein DsbD